ncbi:MAG: hypothetical protein HUU47_10415 [Bacteroidetes bacterium]|nr:hypothetical protein [Bacteroidota bacterium]
MLTEFKTKLCFHFDLVLNQTNLYEIKDKNILDSLENNYNPNLLIEYNNCFYFLSYNSIFNNKNFSFKGRFWEPFKISI